MDWQEKFHAIRALAGQFETCLMMRKPGNWYVSARGVEVSDGVCLRGEYGNGTTPEEAVEDHWRQWVTELKPGHRLVKNAMAADRSAWKWNGFMWEQVTE